MGVNRGKQFESKIRETFEKIPGVSLERLYDSTNGFKGVHTVSDFILYRYPFQYYIECKSCYGKTLYWKNITDNQYRGLIKKDNIPGVFGGFMIWFIDYDMTIFIRASVVKSLRDSGLSGINIIKLHPEQYTILPGQKKRVLFDYFGKQFLDNMENLYE